MLIGLGLAAVLLVGVWLAIEIDVWRRRRRPPGAGALREYYRRMQGDAGDPAERLRDRRPKDGRGW